MDGGEQPLTSHEQRELKKQEKLAARQQQSSVAVAANKGRRTKMYVMIAALVLLAAFGLWKWSLSGITGGIVVDIGDHPTIGHGDVPLVIFGDFQCPFTRQFWQGAFPKILEKYGDKLKIAFWAMPTGKHNYDRASAMAAYCANDQGKFWEYAKLVFDRQGAATNDNLIDYAQESQLDVPAFRLCLASKKYEAKVQSDYEAGRSFNVVQTPTIVIGTQPLSGNLAFDDYKPYIEYAIGTTN